MKYWKIVCLSLLMAAKAGTAMAQTDSLKVENDSITYRTSSWRVSR